MLSASAMEASEALDSAAGAGVDEEVTADTLWIFLGQKGAIIGSKPRYPEAAGPNLVFSRCRARLTGSAHFMHGDLGSPDILTTKPDGVVQTMRGSSEFTERADMYAVIKTGGKQYKVAAGEKIKIEQIAADVGQEIVIDQVLAVGNGTELKVGTPLVAGASVKATVVAQGKHDKVRIFKMRRRKHYKKSQGHRQTYTELEISAVNG